jgi:prepilin-type N-terminal cleavage/methylation domain-containing protein
MNNENGFTLIETLIYLALLSIIIGGGLVVVYGIIEGTNDNFNRLIVEEEGNFLLRKIDWALTGIEQVHDPYGLTLVVGNRLCVERFDGTDKIVEFDLDGTENSVRIRRASTGICAGVGDVPLNSANVAVTGLSFTFIPESGGKPAAIHASTTLTNQKYTQTFVTTKYLRK